MDVTLDTINGKLDAILGLLRAQNPEVADDSVLDGKYGNPVVKAKDPSGWTHGSMLGKTFSQCPSEYLEMVAKRCDYFAAQNDAKGEKASNGKPKSEYDRRDAAIARGWAKRNAGKKVVADEEESIF